MPDKEKVLIIRRYAFIGRRCLLSFDMHYVKLPFQFDAETLLAEVMRLPEEAFAEIESSHINPGGLIACNLLEVDLEWAGHRNDHSDSIEGGPMKPGRWLLACEVIRKVVDSFPCIKNLARIHRLQPGAYILEHTDPVGWNTGLFRIHIPLVTGEGSEFILAGEELRFAAGEAWCLDVGVPHRVRNNDAKERIHLVLDCQRNAWWEELLRGLGVHSIDNKFMRMDIEALKSMEASFAEIDQPAMQSELALIRAELQRRKENG